METNKTKKKKIKEPPVQQELQAQLELQVILVLLFHLVPLALRGLTEPFMISNQIPLITVFYNLKYIDKVIIGHFQIIYSRYQFTDINNRFGW